MEVMLNKEQLEASITGEIQPMPNSSSRKELKVVDDLVLFPTPLCES